jgi:hypothetical protein
LVPTIDGTLHHFTNAGLYDALFVMQDVETKTLWNHITGEALYGELVGRTLGPVGNVLQTNVAQALARDPATRVAISDRMYFAGGKQFGTATGFGGRGPGGPPGAPPGREGGAAAAGGRAAATPPAGGPGRGGPGAGGGRGRGLSPDATLSEIFTPTLGEEDGRRPRMDTGLGVWTDQTRRYYPLETIRARGEAFLDQIDGRSVLVYVDPDTFTPAALFVDATTATLEGKDVRLDNGRVVRSGLLVSQGREAEPVERPQQVFTRWYGFALTFPGTEVFEQ